LHVVTDLDAPSAAGGDAAAGLIQRTPALSLIVPCYNEAGRLPRTLASQLAALSQRPGEVELLVVDDGSTDQTLAVAHAAAARDARVRVIASQPNRGKGFAVRTGVLAAEGQLVAFTDADGSYGPGEVQRVVAALADAPVAIGSRELGAASGSLARRLASRQFNHVIQALLGLPFRDTQSGLKGFQRPAALEIFGRARLDGFAFDAEVLFLARRLGLRISEVPVRAEQRDGSKVQLAVDAVRMLRDVATVSSWAAAGIYGLPDRAAPALPADGVPVASALPATATHRPAPDGVDELTRPHTARRARSPARAAGTGSHAALGGAGHALLAARRSPRPPAGRGPRPS
jgi:dolichyl-phosphate beta-glucosyltransferase